MRHAFGKFGLLLTPKSGHTVYKIPLILAYKKRKKNIFCIHVQCDQIWRNLTTLARCYKTLAILKNVHLLLFGKILSLLWQNLYGFGQKFSVPNGQIMNQYFNNLVTLVNNHRLLDLHKLFRLSEIKIN